MATNIGGVDLSAATAATILTAGAAGGTYKVQFLNRSTTVTATLQLGVSSTTNNFETALKLIESLTLLPLESAVFDGIVCDGTDKYIVAESDVANVNVVAMGYDE